VIAIISAEYNPSGCRHLGYGILQEDITATNNSAITAGAAKPASRSKRGRGGPLSLITSNLYGFSRSPRRLGFFRRKGRLNSWGNRLGLALIIAGIISGLATYAALTETPPFGNDPNTVIWLLNLDLIILLLLVMIIARRMVGLWSGRRQGLAGSRLHVRLVFIFSLLATAPAIIMTVFSAFFFYFGVQSWFSERVRTAVTKSQAVAEAYLSEHQQVIRADTLAMAQDLNRQADFFVTNPEAFNKAIATQTMFRNFSEAVVFDRNGHVYARAGMSYTLEQNPVPHFVLEQTRGGEVQLIAAESDDRVRALTRLDNFLVDAYLYVGRKADPVVMSHLSDTRQAVQEYEQLELQRSDLQVTITMIFVVVALLLLLAAIWFGLVFARQLVTPISALVAASDRVRAGDLTARIPEFDRIDEFDLLARAFNRMTIQIQEQRDELIRANRQLDERRRFTEAVLAGVSSGIIGVDAQGRITLANSSAAELLQRDAKDMTGLMIADIIPDIAALYDQAGQKPGKVMQAEMPYTCKDETKLILLVRIAIERIGEEQKGAVLTFDDITELQAAQRKAAWADVARRIAHEIKNPLTPIQLSAERLKRKYLGQITTDKDIFAQCTDTIIHHVGDIGRMVNEFSAFARMPEPVMQKENLTRHLREMIVLQQQAHHKISFETCGLDQPVQIICDAHQIRQAFTNIIQNAIDSVAARHGEAAERKGKIRVALEKSDEAWLIIVMDNGLGLPKDEDPARLSEPYVTHREKGTGLGLAIVKKIMEDHHGKLVIGTPDWIREKENWRDYGGATVSLLLPAEHVGRGETPNDIQDNDNTQDGKKIERAS